MQRRDFLRSAALTGAGLLCLPLAKSGQMMAKQSMPDSTRWRGFNLCHRLDRKMLDLLRS